jgi:hypothetical protein
MAVLAGGVGLYGALALGFHWVVEPAILSGRSLVPTEKLMADRNWSSEEPTTSGHSLRGAAQISFGNREPARPAEGLATAKAADQAAPDIKVPKQGATRNATRKVHDLQRSAQPRGSLWSFSSSPASPNYR